jgi:hypothetical protein
MDLSLGPPPSGTILDTCFGQIRTPRWSQQTPATPLHRQRLAASQLRQGLELMRRRNQRQNRRRPRRQMRTTTGGVPRGLANNMLNTTIGVTGPALISSTSGTLAGIVPLGSTLGAAPDFISFSNVYDEVRIKGGAVRFYQQQPNTIQPGYIFVVYDNDDNSVTLTAANSATGYRNKIDLHCINNTGIPTLRFVCHGITGYSGNFYNTTNIASQFVASIKTFANSLAASTNYFQTVYYFYCTFRTRR